VTKLTPINLNEFAQSIDHDKYNVAHQTWSAAIQMYSSEGFAATQNLATLQLLLQMKSELHRWCRMIFDHQFPIENKVSPPIFVGLSTK
jgi:hypothetical protein